MIRRAIIDAFLARKTNDFSWLKAPGHPELDQALGELNPPPDFGCSPWLHQKVILLLLLELKRFMIHAGMGSGKTLTILLLLKYRKQCGEKPKAVVFVPYITSVDTWVEEVKKHAPDLKCIPLLGSTAANLEQLGADGDLFVICYQSAVAMVSEAVPGPRGKAKWQLNAKQVREYFAGFDMLVLDEVHKAKNVSSLTYRMCRAISAQCEYVLGLTGTPFGKDLTDLWPQFYLIDFGETLGPTLSFYRAVFFKPRLGYWGGMEYAFKRRLMPALTRIIKHKSISYSINELIDLPPKDYIVKTVPMAVGADAYSQVAIQRINEAVKDGKRGAFEIIESNYLQLRQLSSGFMTLKGEDSKRLQVKFDENPKLDLLMELVEGLPQENKAVVFHHFIFSNKMISDRLNELKIGHARIWGGQKDPLGELHRFKSDVACQVLVINWKSGSSSLNLQNANYLFVYEQPDSPIDRVQGEARLWRPGQDQRVVIYDLITRDTVDWRMYKANQSGEILLKELLSGSVTLS